MYLLRERRENVLYTKKIVYLGRIFSTEKMFLRGENVLTHGENVLCQKNVFIVETMPSKWRKCLIHEKKCFILGENALSEETMLYTWEETFIRGINV